MIEQRKARRFDLKLPFELVRSGSLRVTHVGETVNISSTGVLLCTEARLPVGDAVEYFIGIPTPPGTAGLRIRCLGKVVRVETGLLAITLERYEFLREGAKSAVP